MDTTTVYGASALSFMMLMYLLERRGPVFILGFSLGCLLSSVYGFATLTDNYMEWLADVSLSMARENRQAKGRGLRPRGLE